MIDDFDVVICGTGLKECILGGLLSVHGKKVLQIDRNSYYGGECASLNLTNFFQKFAPNSEPPQSYGANRDWNVDLIPKFVMSCGELVKILLHTKVTRYLEWQVAEGTYVYQYQKAGFFTNEKLIHKVPATEMEALTSSLMSFMEKKRCKNFFHFCALYNKDDKQTHLDFDINRTPMIQVYEHFGLDTNTIDFIGHAVALYTNDDYLQQPMRATMDKINLYMYSLARYGQSPFIYPLYGLGTLPEAFSRLCAIHGGTFMLNKDVDEILYDDKTGQVCGVKSKDGEIARCKAVICDPSYVLNTNKIRSSTKVIRCICILDSMPQGVKDVSSAQIIIPQKQVQRNNDIYIALLSSKHGVAPAGKHLAFISTAVETASPMQEIEIAFSIIGKPQYAFHQVSDVYEAATNGTSDNVYVTSSYDATSHFESATADVLSIWKAMMKEPLDLTIDASALQDEDNQ